MIESKMQTVLKFAMVLFALIALDATAAGQGAVKKVAYDQLSDVVNDFDKYRDGTRLIVTGVPMSAELKFDKAQKMYLFEPNEDAHVANSFWMSPALAKLFRPKLGSTTASLRITSTVIRFVGSFDVFRSPFATRIEGLDENGKVIWTAAGPAPVKLKFRS